MKTLVAAMVFGVCLCGCGSGYMHVAGFTSDEERQRSLPAGDSP